MGALAAILVAAGALAQGQPSLDTLPVPDDLPARPELPPLFETMDGREVETVEEWESVRRPELQRLFQHYVYGYIPESPGIEVQPIVEDALVLDGAAILRQVWIRIEGLPADAPAIKLALFVPRDADGRVPVFLAMNKCGNHRVVLDRAVFADTEAHYHANCPENPERMRGTKRDFWNVDYIVSRGYAFATYHESDLDPDMPDFGDGIHPHFPNLPGAPENRWGTIGAWAWGLLRCVDYLETDAAIEPARICLTGHSRRGKTALFAAAMDERVALVVPHQSGTGGMALSRDNDQETVGFINQRFPHWFNDAFTQFNNREAHLPIDQHLLAALIAPRALLDGAGLQDRWANYESAWRGIRAAAPVWDLYGVPGLVGDRPLGEGDVFSPETCGRLAQFRLDTKHEFNRDYWRAMLDFADLQWSMRR